MRPPVENLVGTITGYDERSGIIHIDVRYDDWYTLAKRGYTKCLVQFSDERILSHKQRNSVYALLRAIADWYGWNSEDMKEILKQKFNMRDEIREMGAYLLSLSDAPMALVTIFQRFLVDFIVENNINCDFDIMRFVDDIPAYIYSCLVHKKCAVCGRNADLHHSTHKVGLGRDRDEIDHIGMDVQPLCRIHHNEAHVMGQKSFDEKYHLESVPLDKTLATIYHIKIKKG